MKAIVHYSHQHTLPLKIPRPNAVSPLQAPQESEYFTLGMSYKMVLFLRETGEILFRECFGQSINRNIIRKKLNVVPSVDE